MRINRQSLYSQQRGIALLTTLAVMLVCLIIFASVFSWVFTNATITQRNNQYNMSQNAAEAALERVIGQIDRDFISQSLSNSVGAYTTLPIQIDQSSWPMRYTFSDTNGNQNQISVVFGSQTSAALPLNSQYAGLNGFATPVDVYAIATPAGQRYNVPATVHESLQLANIPLFQFAIFYNINLEIDPGAAMTISGPVFGNESIWEGSSSCTFASTVYAAGTNCVATSSSLGDPFATSYNGSGAPTFSVAGQPVSHADALVMPIGTNNSPGAILSLLELPPSMYAMGTAAAYSSNGIAYPANGADLVISNFVSGTNSGSALPVGTNFIAYYQDGGLTQLPYDFYMISNGNLHTTFSTNYVSPNLLGSNTNIYYAGFSWLTNVVFYDWREGWNNGSGPPKKVQAIQINITNFSLWMYNTNKNGGSDASTGAVNPEPTKVLHSGHNLNSMYVYTSVPLTSSQLPAVRVANGSQLPTSSGFTVATQFPMYVLGNYNSQTPAGSALGLYGAIGSTTYTYPAALMADAITILSPSWSDSVTNKMPTPSSSTVNAAMLEGIVPTSSTNYSGGVENFMRLLENWGGTLTYNGSIVVLFDSQYATNSWKPTTEYYNPPTRHWSFDFNFMNPNLLPPLTPQIKAMIRGNWYAHQ